MCASKVGDGHAVGSFGHIVTSGDTILWPDVNLTKFDRKLIHFCTIQRDEGSNLDESGKPISSWSDLATEVPCLLEGYPVRMIGRGGVQVFDTMKGVVELLNLMLPAGTDVEAADRITTLVRRSDSVALENGPLYIQEVNHVDKPKDAAEHHVELVLKRLKKVTA